MSPAQVQEIQRERLYRATAEGLRQHGLRLRVHQVLFLSGCSRRAFYEFFTGLEDCILEASVVAYRIRVERDEERRQREERQRVREEEAQRAREQAARIAALTPRAEARARSLAIPPGGWTGRVVDGLIQLRADGETDFEFAWLVVACVAGKWSQKIGRGLPDDDEYLPFDAFFRRACEREWYGEDHVDYIGLVQLLVDEPGRRQSDKTLVAA